MAAKISDRYTRAFLLTRLAAKAPPYLREDLVAIASKAVWAIEDQWWRAEALSELAPLLSLHRLEAAAALIRNEPVRDYRSKLIGAIAGRYIELNQLEPVRKLIDEMNDPDAQSALLRHIAVDRLAKSLRFYEALDFGNAIPLPLTKSECLFEIAHLLVVSGKPYLALSVARYIPEPLFGARGLIEAISLLPEAERSPVVLELDSALANIENPEQRDLLGVARDAALRCDTRHQETGARPRGLAASSSTSDVCLQDVERIFTSDTSQERYVRARALASRLSREDLPVASELWHRTLMSERRTRQEMLAGIRALAPSLLVLEFEDSASPIMEAIMAVSRWWP